MIWSFWCVWFDKRERQDSPAHQIDCQKSSLISHLSFHGSTLRGVFARFATQGLGHCASVARGDWQECDRRAIRYAPSLFPKPQGATLTPIMSGKSVCDALNFSQTLFTSAGRNVVTRQASLCRDVSFPPASASSSPMRRIVIAHVKPVACAVWWPAISQSRGEPLCLQ